MKIIADEICCRLQEMLKGKEKIHGTVHSVFNRVCNISFNDWPIVSLILCSVPIKPFSISISLAGVSSLQELGLVQWQKVLCCKDKISIAEAELEVSLIKAKPVDCRPVFQFEKESQEQVKANIRELPFILHTGNPKGLLPLISEFEEMGEVRHKKLLHNRYSEFALPRLKKLLMAIEKGAVEEISAASRGIVGFGPGLTPSSDDMLIGLMISLIYASEYYGFPKGYAEAINSALLKGAEERTNQLSYEMMRFAARGEVTENLHQLMNSIYFNSGKKLYASTLGVMDYGETSGSDMLLGIYLGCRLCENKIENVLIKNKA